MKYDTVLLNMSELWLQIWEYVVYGSWPLWVRWLRETDDIDICVLRSVREKLIASERYNVVITKYWNESFILWNMEVAYTIPWLDFNEIELAVMSPDIIDWVAYLSLGYTKQSKTWMNRPKDIADIRLIDEYLLHH